MQDQGIHWRPDQQRIEPVSRAVESTTKTRRPRKILQVDYLQVSEEDKVGLIFMLWLSEDQK